MREAISEGYKAAMKARDARRTATLRSISAAIKDKDIEARGQGKSPLGEQEIVVLLQKMVKQREESLGIYDKAGREDLAVVEREEIAILNEFLPQGLSEAEIEAAIIDAIKKTGAEGGKDVVASVAVRSGDEWRSSRLPAGGDLSQADEQREVKQRVEAG